MALLQLHDSAELLLQLSAEHVNAGEGSQGFLDYWERLSSRVTGGIPHKEKMRRLNKARVNLKHNGTLPAREDLLGFGDAVREFLKIGRAHV